MSRAAITLLFGLIFLPSYTLSYVPRGGVHVCTAVCVWIELKTLNMQADQLNYIPSPPFSLPSLLLFLLSSFFPSFLLSLFPQYWE